VDQDVEPAERAADLQRDGVHVFLPRDVADDAVAAGDLARDATETAGVAGDEGDRVAARRERFDEGEAEARRAAGDGDAKRCSRGRVVRHHGDRSEAMVRR